MDTRIAPVQCELHGRLCLLPFRLLLALFFPTENCRGTTIDGSCKATAVDWTHRIGAHFSHGNCSAAEIGLRAILSVIILARDFVGRLTHKAHAMSHPGRILASSAYFCL